MDGSEHRLETRSNLFVIATLYSDEGSAPVRVRNMSRSGALIEGAVLPPVGSAIKLCRGRLSVVGTVAWLEDRKAGLRFDASIAVAEWLPGGQRGAGQQLSDEMAHRVRVGAGPASIPASPAASSGLHDELLRIARSLERAAEELANDGHVAAGHGGPLQLIDVAAQALRKLAGDSAPSSRSTAC